MLSPLAVSGKAGLQVVGKEKDFKNSKHDKQFNQDNQPQSLSQRHCPETIQIKPDNPLYEDKQDIFHEVSIHGPDRLMHVLHRGYRLIKIIAAIFSACRIVDTTCFHKISNETKMSIIIIISNNIFLRSASFTTLLLLIPALKKMNAGEGRGRYSINPAILLPSDTRNKYRTV
jgi:hypothetical protein